MQSETFASVNMQMEAGRQSLRDARTAIKNALHTMTDTEGVNLPFTKDIYHTISQLLERYDSWQARGQAPLQEEEQAIGDTVRLLGSGFEGTITAIYPNYEESGLTAYAVRMPQSAIAAGYLPIEILSSTLLDVPTL